MFSWMLPPGSWQVVCGAVLFGGIVTFFDWASPPSPPSLPTAGGTAEPGGVTEAAAGRALEAAAGGRGRKGTFSWSQAPEAAGVFLLLQFWGLPSFSVAKLSDLDVAASGLCVAPVQAQLALMNCCSLFPPLF